MNQGSSKWMIEWRDWTSPCDPQPKPCLFFPFKSVIHKIHVVTGNRAQNQWWLSGEIGPSMRYVGYSGFAPFRFLRGTIPDPQEFHGIPAGAGIPAKIIPGPGVQESILLQEFLAGILSH